MPMLHAHNLPPNVEVYRRRRPGKAMYFIAAGQVQFRTAGHAEVYGTGDFFGVGPMLGGEGTGGAFITTSRCRLLKLFREDFHRLETTHPDIAAHIRATAERRRQARSGTGGQGR